MKLLMTLLTLATLALSDPVPGDTITAVNTATGELAILEVIDIIPTSEDSYALTVYNYETDTYSTMEVNNDTNEKH